MIRRAVLALLTGALLTLGLGARAAGPPPLRVLAAASLTDVLPRAGAAWQAAGGQGITWSFEASSRLAAQLAAGAPADLFFSADAAWMDEVAARGLIQPGSRVDLLGNALVAVVPTSATARPATPQALAAVEGPVALAGETVPAGRYAQEALRHAGVWGAVAPRVVSGENVRAVLAWVARGEASWGVVYATDARVEPRVATALTFPAGSHAPIVYPAAVTAEAGQGEAAARFLAFCAGAGRGVFEAAGFTVLPSRSP